MVVGRESGVPGTVGNGLGSPEVDAQDLGLFDLLEGEVGQLEYWEKNFPRLILDGLSSVGFGGEGTCGEVLGDELERGKTTLLLF